MLDRPVSDDPVLVRLRLTREDLADVVRVTRRAEQRWLAAYVAAVVVVVAAMVAARLDGRLAVPIGAFLLALLAVLLLRAVRLRLGAVGLTYLVEFAPSGVTYELGQQAGHQPWPGLGVRHEGGVLMLARGRRQILAVPSRALSASDLARIADWAADAPAAAPATDSAAGDVVTESPDGSLTVRGRLTTAQARRLVDGTVPAVHRALTLAVVLVLVIAWAADLAGIGNGPGARETTVALTVGLLSVLAVKELAAYLLAVRTVARLEGQPVEWHLSPQGATSTSVLGQTYLGWELVRDAVVNGDLLVVRYRGAGTSIGYLVGALSAEQRRRLFGWVEAATGKRVAGAR